MLFRKLLPVPAIALLAGCAIVPQWNPQGHSTVAVISAVNPTADQQHVGITIFGNSRTPANIGFDVNAEITSVVKAALTQSGRYTIVDVPFDPKTFSSATSTWETGWSMMSLPKPLADPLVEAAKGTSVDHLIVVIDARAAPNEISGGWGLYQHRGGCYDAYINFYVFVLDAHTGATVASWSREGFRRIEDIDWDMAWSDIPADKQAETLADLKSIADEDVPRALMRIGVIADDNKEDYQAWSPNPLKYPPTCKPIM